MLKKIPKFDEVKEWAIEQGWVTSQEAQDAAPVQSVNGSTGDVEVESVSDYNDLENTPTETQEVPSESIGYSEVFRERVQDDGTYDVDVVADGFRLTIQVNRSGNSMDMEITTLKGETFQYTLDDEPEVDFVETVSFEIDEIQTISWNQSNFNNTDDVILEAHLPALTPHKHEI